MEPQSHYSPAEPSSYLTVTLYLSNAISLSQNVCVSVTIERQMGASKFSGVVLVSLGCCTRIP